VRRRIRNCVWTALIIFLGWWPVDAPPRPRIKSKKPKRPNAPDSRGGDDVRASEVIGSIEVTGSLSYKFGAK